MTGGGSSRAGRAGRPAASREFEEASDPHEAEPATRRDDGVLTGAEVQRTHRMHGGWVHAVSRLTLCVVAQWAKSVMLGREVYVYDSSRMLVFSADLTGLKPDFDAVWVKFGTTSIVSPGLTSSLSLPPMSPNLYSSSYPRKLTAFWSRFSRPRSYLCRLK
jgi:hypothetical protein